MIGTQSSPQTNIQLHTHTLVYLTSTLRTQQLETRLTTCAHGRLVDRTFGIRNCWSVGAHTLVDLTSGVQPRPLPVPTHSLPTRGRPASGRALI